MPNDASVTQQNQNTPKRVALFALFGETGLLLGRYFIVVYPIFLYLILSSFLLPHAVPDFSQWAWWVLTLGMAAILFIFKAGWNLMMYEAVKEWQALKQSTQDTEGFQDALRRIPFGLLKQFVPGMGQYGLPFLIGGILWLLLVTLPATGFLWYGFSEIGVPAFFEKILNSPDPLTPHQLEALLQSLPALEQAQLTSWRWLMLGLGVVLLIINVLTFYWQQFLVVKSCNPFQAFIYSIKQACAHPFHSFLMIVYYNFFYLLFTLLGGLSGLGAFLGSFFLILTIAFFGLLTYRYLDETHGPPTP